MTAMSKYYTDNLNDGHIEYIYYVCIAGSLVAIPCFVYFFRCVVLAREHVAGRPSLLGDHLGVVADVTD
jgi:hypothetical protein